MSDAAQPGAVAALLATLSLLTFLMATQEGRFTDWLLFGATTAALIWVHQLGFLHVAVLHIAAGDARWRRRQRGQPTSLFVAGWMIALALGTAAITGLVMYRSGIGPPTVLPPFEYATTGAPGAGRSVFGLAGTAITGLLGFHPADVTSRLLALWPLCILATFVFLGRAWSKRAMLVAALAITPFVALLTLQIVGSPRNPPFALTWTATAIPMLAIGVGRALSLQPRWSKVRLVGLLAVAVLLVAAVDQNRRVQPESRFDVAPVVDHVAAQAGAGDVVVYAPDILGDLVTQRAHDAEAISTSDASEVRLADARRVFVFGAFAFNGDDASLQRALGLVKALSARRPLTSEWQHGEAKVWTFE